jgi:hypothetical protein
MQRSIELESYLLSIEPKMVQDESRNKGFHKVIGSLSPILFMILPPVPSSADRNLFKSTSRLEVIRWW